MNDRERKKYEDELRRKYAEVIKRSAEGISQSKCFLIPWEPWEDRVKDTIALIQMGIAVYLDKPMVVLLPEGKPIPENLRKMAAIIERYKDGDLSSIKDATERALIALAGKGLIG